MSKLDPEMPLAMQISAPHVFVSRTHSSAACSDRKNQFQEVGAEDAYAQSCMQMGLTSALTAPQL